ncbi:MAG: ABC-F family ATP-binding cassette domain-containing protein [Spirochaetales bacterium]|nr:ABC-F family ATP-binding cassette domain-containing protein [Spirochaetales bacterium]
MKDIIFSNVNFSYNLPLLININAHFTKGWSGIVGVNGGGKTTIIHLAVGILEPDSGNITTCKNPAYCDQRPDLPPANFSDFIFSVDKESNILKGKLRISDKWLKNWDSLSYGERKRVQIGAALWQNPDLLALDEPTNHLDNDGKQFLFEALKDYRGIGLLVSHDRYFIDELCTQCLFINPPYAIMRPGGITEGQKEEKREIEYNLKTKGESKKQVRSLKQVAVVRRERAARSHQKRSKKGIAIKDHDARFKKNLARISGKDSVDGKLLRQMEGRIKHAEQREGSINTRRIIDVHFWLPGKKRKSDYLFRISKGKISVGDITINHPNLNMTPNDRIALVGRNGSGKTTLINSIISNMKLSDYLYIPQEISREESRKIIREIKKLPNNEKGHLFTVIAGLGSDPKKLLDTLEPSPGELRKLMLALGITESPSLIIMDEPTNHLDLPSILSLESALKSCPAGLLLVSHDYKFLKACTQKEWRLIEEESCSFLLKKGEGSVIREKLGLSI